MRQLVAEAVKEEFQRDRRGRGRTEWVPLLCHSEVWEWVLRSRIFDSYSSPWNRVYMNFP